MDCEGPATREGTFDAMIVINATTVIRNVITREAAIAVLKSFLKARMTLMSWPTRPSRSPASAANFFTDSISWTTEYTLQRQALGNWNGRETTIFSHLSAHTLRFGSTGVRFLEFTAIRAGYLRGVCNLRGRILA